MEGNFSSKVRDVIQFSREEALRLGHDYIGTGTVVCAVCGLPSSFTIWSELP
jgi:ATP-dependent Clp protease ATP-binding subunit ClpC